MIISNFYDIKSDTIGGDELFTEFFYSIFNYVEAEVCFLGKDG